MFKLPNQNHKKVTKGRFSHSTEEACPGTPLYRKKLGEGIQAEANNDGTIFIAQSVEPGSAEERQILTHEMKHLTDMKIGKMKYDDNWIKYNGMEYPRAEGKILYEGEWIDEGSKEFPWEKH
tara:strand:+ start:459 stop:824 length:366 start_codon:yes stop_codon:yes gene_type:complete